MCDVGRKRCKMRLGVAERLLCDTRQGAEVLRLCRKKQPQNSRKNQPQKNSRKKQQKRSGLGSLEPLARDKIIEMRLISDFGLFAVSDLNGGGQAQRLFVRIRFSGTRTPLVVRPPLSHGGQ